MARAWRVVVVTAATVVLAGAAAWFFVLRDDVEPVGIGDAVTSFREDTEGRSGPSPIPEGIYVYRTTGYERIDALAGTTHRYPSRSTIAVTTTACGVSFLWRVLRGRSTEWIYCVTGDGLVLVRQDERHTFFGRSETTTYRCQRGAVPRRTGAVVFSCSTGSARERGRMSFVGRERVRVGSRVVVTSHVRRVSRFTGAIEGKSTYDIWFATSGLPVKLFMASRTTNDSPIGDVDYEEEATLVLRSLVPRR